MSNRVWLTGDTHFGHKKLLLLEPTRAFDSVEEHDEELVRRWNDAVKPKDTVWHLGDVLFGTALFDILPRLNGIKRLVMGNHDQYPIERYIEHFSSIHGCAVYRDCILTHVPVHPYQKYRFKANVHGHMHNAVLDDPWYINVCMERHNLTPVLADKLIPRDA